MRSIAVRRCISAPRDSNVAREIIERAVFAESASGPLCARMRHGDHQRAGEIKAYQFYPAVMHSAARLTYTEVAAVLTNTKGPEAAKRADLLPQLQNLYGVYKSLHAARQKRGAIDFDTTETYIVCNAQG